MNILKNPNSSKIFFINSLIIPYSVFWSRSLFPQLLPGLLPPPYPMTSCYLFYSLAITSSMCCLYNPGHEATHWSVLNLPGTIPLKKTDCLPQKLLAIPRSSDCSGGSSHPPCSMLDVDWLGHKNAGLMQTAKAAVSSWLQCSCPCPGNIALLWSLPTSGCSNPFPLLW